MLNEKFELERIFYMRKETERLEDLIDSAYAEVDQENDEQRIKELRRNIVEWKLLSDELEDLIELSYWRLDQRGDTQIC